jgi:hypothetical protein
LGVGWCGEGKTRPGAVPGQPEEVGADSACGPGRRGAGQVFVGFLTAVILEKVMSAEAE